MLNFGKKKNKVRLILGWSRKIRDRQRRRTDGDPNRSLNFQTKRTVAKKVHKQLNLTCCICEASITASNATCMFGFRSKLWCGMCGAIPNRPGFEFCILFMLCSCSCIKMFWKVWSPARKSEGKVHVFPQNELEREQQDLSVQLFCWHTLRRLRKESLHGWVGDVWSVHQALVPRCCRVYCSVHEETGRGQQTATFATQRLQNQFF